VDAHQHVWNPATADYPWLTPDLTVLDREYDQPDVAAELRTAGIDLTVLVQAADNLEDSENMFRVAAGDPLIAGVVAWVPLDDVTAAEKILDRWAGRPVVGIRHLIHIEPDPRWVLRPDVSAGLDLLAERGLAFDVCAETPELLATVPALAAAHPNLRLVVDHLGLVALLFAPAQVHAHEHLGPVLGLGAARTRVDGDDGVVAVSFAGEHAHELELAHAAHERGDLLADLLEHGLVVRRELDELGQIVRLLGELVEALDGGLVASAFTQHFLRVLLVVPEARRLRVVV
jgi:hypothetical protein